MVKIICFFKINKNSPINKNKIKFKYKNIIKLILWAIFILFVVCLCIVLNKNQIKNNNKEESRLEFKHKIHNLANKKLKVYYKIDDYIVEGVYENDIFKGTLTYDDGTSYNVKYEKGNLTKDNDNEIEDFLIVNIDTRYINPYYLIDLFNKNEATEIEKNKKYLYEIDDVKYYLSFKDNGGYSVRIINDNKENILNYEVM